MKILIACYFSTLSAILGILFVLPVPKEYKGILTRCVFNIIIESVLLLASRFLWKQLSSVIDYTFAHNFVCKTSLKVCLVLFCIFAQLSHLTNFFFLDEEPHWFPQMCYSCLGTFIQLGIWLGFVNIVTWILKELKFISKLSKKSKAVKVLLACIYAVSVSMYGLYRGSQLPSVRSVHIPIKSLGKAFQDFKIVQINDIHLGPTVGRTRLQGIIDIVNSLQPGRTTSASLLTFVCCNKICRALHLVIATIWLLP